MSLIMLIALSLGFGCSCNQAEDPVVEQKDGVQTLGTQNNDFAFRLYNKADKPGKNLFYSPYSITSALGMVYGGANGNTATQIAEAMSFTLPEMEQHAAFGGMQQNLNAIGKRDKAELNVANALFGAKKNEDLLVPDYINLLKKFYESELYSLDFSDAKGTAKYINTWVENKTNDRIKDLVSEDHIRDSNDGLVLVNAIFFKGKWLKTFDPKRTIKDDFYTSYTERTPETSRPVEMMSIQDDYRYAEMPGYQILELPYAEDDLAMIMVLPDDIDKLKTDLNNDNFAKWQNALTMQEVQVNIPRFKFDITLEGLSEMLKAMGMTDAFSEFKADFSGIRKGTGLYILDVVHKAFVEVKEEGTEAAAATAVIMATKAAPGQMEPVPVFRADKPFVYMIIHKPSNAVLFLGKMTEPPKL